MLSQKQKEGMGMSVSVSRQTLQVESLCGEATAQLPVRAEALLSGAGRENVEVLMEDACAQVGRVEAQSDRAVVTGLVQCQAVCVQGQEGTLRAAAAQAPFEQILEIPGAKSGMRAEAQACVLHVEAAWEAGRIVFSVTVEVWARVRESAPVEAVDALSGDEPVEIRTRTLRTAAESSPLSRAVVLRDSVSLPAELSARMPLMYWARPEISACVRDLGGVRVSGDAAVEAMVLSGVESRPVAVIRYRLPFEELVEAPDGMEGECRAQAEVRGLDVTVEADGEDSRLRIECSLLLTARVIGAQEIQAVEDAYGTGAQDVELTRQQVTLEQGERLIRGEESFRGTVLLPEGAPAVGTALCAHALPVLGGVRVQGEGSLAEGILEITALYLATGSGRVCSVRTEQPFQLALPGKVGEESRVTVSASGEEAAALMSDRLQFSCRLSGEARQREAVEARVVTGAQETDAPPRRKGIGIVYPQPGERLWDVARRHRVPVARLKEWNGNTQEAQTGKPLIVYGS